MMTIREKLLACQPTAIKIRFADKCPDCKRKALVSYQLPGIDHDRGEKDETCGYFCGACGWGNAGSREKEAK